MKIQTTKSLVSFQAGLMSLGTFLSRIFGFVRDLCIAAFFSKTETDIFFVAFRFPNFFRKLLGEGSFSASVTPALTEKLYKDRLSIKKLHSALFTLLFCTSCLLSLLGILFMEEIMELFFSHSAYGAIEGKLEKTILVGRIVFSYLFFVSLYSYFMSVVQVFGKFFLPAVAPALFNISLIAFALTPKSWWPFPVLSLAWAVIVGGILQLLPVLYEIYKLDLIPRFIFRFKEQAVLRVAKRFLPGMIGLSGLSLIGLINVYFSAWLEEGTVSYIYYGDRLLEFPRSLIAVSLGTALIPELTKLYSLDSLSDFKKTSSYYLRFVLFLTLPAALVFVIIPEPIIELLFKRGEFDSASVLQTAAVLQVYSVVLIFSSLSRIFSSCFFAINKNWHIVMCTGIFVLFHLICASLLIPHFELIGLVGATALSSVFYFLLLLFVLFRLIGALDLYSLVKVLVKILPGLFIMALCLLSYDFVFKAFHLVFSSSWSLFLSLFTVLILGGASYIISSLLIGEVMAQEFIDMIKKIFKKLKMRKTN